MYCISEYDDGITEYNIWNADEFFTYPHARDCEKVNQKLTTPKIDMGSSPRQRNKRMLSRDIRHQWTTTMNKDHHILLTTRMRPLVALLRSLDPCILHRFTYRHQIDTQTDSNGWIETPNGHSNDEDLKGGNNWFDDVSSKIERTNEIPRRITRQSTGSRILSRTIINQVCP